MRQLLTSDETITDVAGVVEFPEPAADRPWVASNFAMSLDGRVAINGRAAGVGSDADQRWLHHLREFPDAVMIGAGTMRAERYGPLIRPEHAAIVAERRQADGQRSAPVAVIVSRSMDLPWDAPLFTDGSGLVVIATVTDSPEPPVSATPLHVIRSGELAVDLTQLMQTLRHEWSIGSLVCEGGPHLHGELIAAGLVDELFVTLAPQLIGVNGSDTLVATPLPTSQPLRCVSLIEHDSELFMRWRVLRP